MKKKGEKMPVGRDRYSYVRSYRYSYVRGHRYCPRMINEK